LITYYVRCCPKYFVCVVPFVEHLLFARYQECNVKYNPVVFDKELIMSWRGTGIQAGTVRIAYPIHGAVVRVLLESGG